VKKSTKVSNELPPATPATPRKVYVTPFTVEGADPTLAPRANAIRLAAIETLRAFPEIRITDNPAADVLSVTPTLRAGAAGPELALPGAAAIPVGDVAGGVPPVVQFVTAKLNLPPRISTSSAAMNAFGDAVSAVENAKIDAALRTTLKADPKFLPAQLMAMRFFTSEGKNADAVEAAKQVVMLDPTNMDAAHAVVTASLAAGDLTSAFNAYGAILKQDPKNADALNTLGRYALAAGDTQKFGTCLARVKPDQAMIHEPDVLVAAGRIDTAADKYYDVKVKNPGNVSLSLKIGRLSVLRHGVQIAEDELKNQQTMDPKYGAHILQAYIYAQGGNRAGAMTEMETAKASSKPGDEYYTDLAEVSALAGDPKATVDALENAANHKEPTAAYILASPLFTFLQSDARFNKVREKMTTGQLEIRTALGGVAF
jgi:tetratricopeptide (TPR) repeat protein